MSLKCSYEFRIMNLSLEWWKEHAAHSTVSTRTQLDYVLSIRTDHTPSPLHSFYLHPPVSARHTLFAYGAARDTPSP